MKNRRLGISLSTLFFALNLAFANTSTLDGLLVYPHSDQDTLEAGDQYCVQIRADGFTEIVAFQFSVNWDPTALQFDSLTGLNLPSMDINNFNTLPDYTNNGQVTVAWYVDIPDAVTLPDGGSLFEICFTVLPTAQENVVIEITGSPTAIEFVNSAEDIVDATPGSNELFVPTPTLGLSLGQGSVAPGETVCIPMTVGNFVNISGFQFTLIWDTAQLAFTGVQAFNLQDLSINNFNISSENDVGILRCIWTETGVSGVSVGNNTAIFEICFQATGSLETAVVDFSDTPVMIGATDVNDNTVIVETTAGEITISGIPVWPGDTDTSEVVNNFDLLNIGLAYGETGPQRPNASLTWVEQPAALWSYHTPESGTNAAHIDADGNGVVDDGDVQALDQNWGETTNFWGNNEENRGVTIVDPPLVVDTATVNPGQEATFDILFGDETTPAEGIYGLAFTLIYDPGAVIPGSVNVTFADSWLGTENSELITIFRDRPEDNRIDIALSRTDHSNRDGQGAIGQLHLTIAEITPGAEGYPLPFQIENTRIISNVETLITAATPITYSEVMGTVNTQAPELTNQVSIYPIPARDFLQIKAEGLTIQTVDILGLDGKKIQHFDDYFSRISVNALDAGTYILQIQTNKGWLQKSFVKY